MNKLQIRYKVGDSSDQFVSFEEAPIVIGTLLSNRVVLRTTNVDPIHALIESNEAGDYTITDLGSQSGVFVNGQRISIVKPLQTGDQIRIGAIDLFVEEFVPVVQSIPKPPIPIRPEPKPVDPATVPVASARDNATQINSSKLDPSAVKSKVESKLFGSLSARTGVSERDSKSKQEEESSEEPVRSSKSRSPFTQAPRMDSLGDDSTEFEEDERTSVSEEKKKAIARRSEESQRYSREAVLAKSVLFSPKKARPTGHVLEVVSFWDHTIVDVNMFHPSLKNFDKVTLGYSEKAHFLAADENAPEISLFASVGNDSYGLRLIEGMTAKIRKDGEVQSVKGPAKIKLDRRDLAHVQYGPLQYFFVFVQPPMLDMPKERRRDPLFSFLITASLLFYAFLIPALWLATPKPEKNQEDDIWALVQLPKKEEKPEVPKTPPVKVVEVEKKPEVPVPPKPQPKPVKVAKPVEVEKPKQTKAVETPKDVTKPSTENTKKAEQVADKVKEAQQAAGENKTKEQGMASTGAKSPDFKKAGPKTPDNSQKTGGNVGSGMGQTGGARKGDKSISEKGVEGVNNNKPSGVNLSKLGLGVGKILDKTAPGAIQTNFKSSAGGAGGGSGSASRTYGLGGMGSSASLGISGSGSAVNQFGSGAGGYGSGEGGTGGLGGAGLGKGFGSGGRGRANVSVPSQGPAVSEGLSRQEVLAVIRANLNQIRYCYERLLQSQPNASGRVAVSFVISASGGVSSSSITDSEISDSAMQSCITGKIARWKFPEPKGATSVTVNYPFTFTPS